METDEDYKRFLLEELITRKKYGAKLGKTLRSPIFLLQNSILDDKSRFKALNATRRGAKSVTEAISHIETMDKYPNSKQLYMGLTLESAAEIIWDVLKELDYKAKIGIKFNNGDYIATHPNGSRIRLFGADASQYEIKKVLGQKVRKVSVDEAGSYSVDLENIVKKCIYPALIDLKPYSFLSLLGTCENIPNTYFEKVTMGEDPDIPWKIYRWNTEQNPYMERQWKEEIADMKERNPNVIKTSWFKTHYLNEWCSDDDLLIISLDKEVNSFSSRPKHDWSYILGVDLGFNDDTAFTVLSWSTSDPYLYAIESYKRPGMDFTEVAAHIKKLDKKYDFSKMIVDGANKQGVMELVRRHHLPLQSASKNIQGAKQFKRTALGIIRDMAVEGLIKVDYKKCDVLVTEWSKLQWKDKTKTDEDPRCANHASDSFMYAALDCRNYLYEKEKKKPHISSPEFLAEQESKEERMFEKYKKIARFDYIADEGFIDEW